MRTVSVTIRNIPVTVVNQLKNHAAMHHRSMQGELLAILETAASKSPRSLSAAQVLARVRERGLNSPAESTAMIRADRDR